MKRAFLAFDCALLVAIVATAQPSIEPHSVVLCEHENLVGECRTFRASPSMRYALVPTLGSLDDETSSLIVGPSTTLHAFEHRSFGGRSYSFSAHSDDQPFSRSAMPAGWNDAISSLIVVPDNYQWVPEGALLIRTLPPNGPQKQLSGSGGWFFSLPQQVGDAESRYATVPAGLNDGAVGLRICGPHLSVTLFEHANFQGRRLDLPGLGPKPDPGCTLYSLDTYEFAHVTSSLIVRTSAPGPRLVQPKIPKPPPPRGGEAAGEPHRAPPAVPELRYEAAPVGSVTLEPDTNRRGQDYVHHIVTAAHDAAYKEYHPEGGAGLCQSTCESEPKCKAFTYVKPGFMGPDGHCWLKSGVPPAEHAPCCVSGVKR